MIALLLGPAFAGGLSGTVLGFPDGEPLAGVYVVAWDLRLSYTYTLSGDDGTWALDDLPAGSYRLEAYPPDGDNRVVRFWPDTASYCEAERLALAEGEERTGLDFALPVGATLEGRLLDEAGAPVAGAEIKAEDPEAGRVSRYGESDAEGRFAVTGLDVGADGTSAWTCAVEVKGWPDQYLGGAYEPDEATLVVIEEQEVLDLGDQPLLSGILVLGTAEGPDGPLPGASVHVYAAGQVVTVEAGASGSWEAVGLPPGDVLPWASADGYATTYYPDADRPGETLPAEEEGAVVKGADLTLPLQAVFRATLLGEGGPDEDLSGVTGLLYNSTSTVGFGARASADGALAIEGLHGGDYTLYVFAADEGYANDFIRDEDGEPVVYTVADGSDAEAVEITLPARSTVSALLVDDAGAAIYGAYLLGWPQDDQDDSAAAASAAADGTVRLDGLASGRWKLQARYSGYCEEADPGYVPVWYPDSTPNEDYADAIDLDEAEDLADLVFVLPRDDDHDGMSDAWEEEHGLDPTRDDGAEDADGDGYPNLDEYLLGTDPVAAGSGGAGCCAGDGKRALLLPFGLLFWSGRRRRA